MSTALCPACYAYSRNSCWLNKMTGESLIIVTFIYLFFYCCGASVASEQQHNQDLIRIYVRILEFITFCQTAFHLTRVHCATFYQSALRHKQYHDVTASSRRPFSRGFQSAK